MIPFFLLDQLQFTSVKIITDNAKTHSKKSRGRRQKFVRSQSEPVVTSQEGRGLPGWQRSSKRPQTPKDRQPEQRPGMCRWNSFTQRSSASLLDDRKATDLASNLKVNASKPVRRGSWGKGNAPIPKRKPSLNSKIGPGRPPRQASK